MLNIELRPPLGPQILEKPKTPDGKGSKGDAKEQINLEQIADNLINLDGYDISPEAREAKWQEAFKLTGTKSAQELIEKAYPEK